MRLRWRNVQWRMTKTAPPTVAGKRCGTCRELPAKCRCRTGAEATHDPVEPVARSAPHGLLGARGIQPVELGGDAALATAHAGLAVSVGGLSAAVEALVLDHAGRAGLTPAEWVARAVRAYAKAPATAAERMRASRERKRMALEENQPKGKST